MNAQPQANKPYRCDNTECANREIEGFCKTEPSKGCGRTYSRDDGFTCFNGRCEKNEDETCMDLPPPEIPKCPERNIVPPDCIIDPTDNQVIQYRCDNKDCITNDNDGHCNAIPKDGCGRTLGEEEMAVCPPPEIPKFRCDTDTCPQQHEGYCDEDITLRISCSSRSLDKNIIARDPEEIADEAIKEEEVEEKEPSETINYSAYTSSDANIVTPEPIHPITLSNICFGALARTFDKLALDLAYSLEEEKDKGSISMNVTLENVGRTKDWNPRLKVSYSIKAKIPADGEGAFMEQIVKSTDSKHEAGMFVETCGRHLVVAGAARSDTNSPIPGQLGIDDLAAQDSREYGVDDGGVVEFPGKPEEDQPFTGEETGDIMVQCVGCDRPFHIEETVPTDEDSSDDRLCKECAAEAAQGQGESAATEDKDNAALRPVQCEFCGKLVGHMDDGGNVVPEDAVEAYQCVNEKCGEFICLSCADDGKCPKCGSLLLDTMTGLLLPGF